MKTGRAKDVCVQILIVASLMFTATGCTGTRVQTRQYSPEEVVHYSRLKNGDEAGTPNGRVFYVDRGETIPLKISMETDFMGFKQDRIDIIARQKLYFRIEIAGDISADQMKSLKRLDARALSGMTGPQRAELLKYYTIYVSKDALQWAPLEDRKACREVLGFKGGLLSFVIQPNGDGGFEASLDIKTTK